MITRFILTVSFLFCAAFLSACSNEEVTDGADIRATLEEKLAETYGPLWKTGDPQRYVDEVLTDDAVITASDSPAVWAGDAQNTPLIAELMAAYPQIKATPVWTRAIGPNAAYQFVKFELLAADESEAPIAAKSLYVWVKTKDGWRIAADHYGYSSMDDPTGVTQ